MDIYCTGTYCKGQYHLCLNRTHTQSWVTSIVTGSSITVTSVIGHHHTLCRGDEVLVRYDYIPFTLQFQQQKDFAHRTSPHKTYSTITFMHHFWTIRHFEGLYVPLFKLTEVLQFFIPLPPLLKLTHTLNVSLFHGGLRGWKWKHH